jgi:prevent-host-death family protein
MADASAERKEGDGVERVEIGSLALRARLTDVINRVSYNGHRYVITRNGKPYAALVGPRDLEKLEAAEAPAGAA